MKPIIIALTGMICTICGVAFYSIAIALDAQLLAVYGSMGIYAIGAVFGTVALIKNRTCAEKFDIFGYIFAGMGILPLVLAGILFGFWLFLSSAPAA